MGSYKWSIEHECAKEDVADLLLDFEFTQTDDDEFVITVNEWKSLNVTTKKSEIEFVFHWMGDSTTEVYFDYLINCGVLMGQLMWALEDLAVNGVDEEEGEESEG